MSVAGDREVAAVGRQAKILRSPRAARRGSRLTLRLNRSIGADHRTLAHPDAPRHGRRPAPWLPWGSVSSAVPWSEPPFSEQVQNGVEGLPNDALATVGLPPVTTGAHPIAKAMVLAALLRSVPWKGDGTSLGGRLLPAPDPSVAVVGICRCRLCTRQVFSRRTQVPTRPSQQFLLWPPETVATADWRRPTVFSLLPGVMSMSLQIRHLS